MTQDEDGIHGSCGLAAVRKTIGQQIFQGAHELFKLDAEQRRTKLVRTYATPQLRI